MASTMHSANMESKSRKRLRPLLEKLLNENSIPQLFWMDRERKIWQMPWRHHKQTRWGDPDAFMLREMARSLYGHTESGEPEKEKLKHWKELLRNALTSLHDVSELKDLHSTDGDSPYKVYQFINCEPKGGRRRRSRGWKAEHSHETTPAVGFSPGSSSSSNDCSQICGNLPNYLLPLTSSITSYSDYGVQKHCTYDNSAPQQQCLWNVNSSQFTNVPRDNTLSMQSLLREMHGASNIVSDTFADEVDDNYLSQWVSDLSLDKMSYFPSCSISFRSRSPLHHDNEEIHQPEVSVNDAQIVGRATVPLTTVCSSVAPIGNMLNNSSNFTPNVLSPLFVITDTAHVSAFQKITESLISNIKADHIGCCSKGRPEEYDTSSTLYMDNTTPGKNDEAIPDTMTSNSEIYQCINNDFLQLIDTGMFPYSVNHQSHISLDGFRSSSARESLDIAVYYHTKYVAKKQVVSGKIRICFVPDNETRESIICCQDQQQFGPNDADMFELPKVENSELNKQARDIKKILNHLIRGIIIELRNGDIYATRYCRAVPHFCTPGQTDCQKLGRLQETKIFDFQNNFKLSFDPDCGYPNRRPHVRLVFAMKDPNRKSPALTIDICHKEASTMTVAAEANGLSLEPDCSMPDDYDNILDIERDLKTTNVNIYTSNFLQ